MIGVFVFARTEACLNFPFCFCINLTIFELSTFSNLGLIIELLKESFVIGIDCNFNLGAITSFP